uniref:Uncharacterized protein n=1 Tax=Cacopsylla melanoneura TaxID=428564 RepID=A0A8D9BL84_9HEMI
MGVNTAHNGSEYSTQSGKETLETLIQAHFPGSENIDCSVPSDTVRPGTSYRRPQKDDWKLAKRVVTHNRLDWALGTFEPYKAAGNDGIFPALLQQAKEMLIPILLILCKLFRASIYSNRLYTNDLEEWKGAVHSQTKK